MSSIPNAKMKHAHAPNGEPAPKAEKKSKAKAGPTLSDRAKHLGERAEELAEDAVDAIKERPKTAAAIGAAVLAGAAALVSGPAIAKAFKGEEPKKPTGKKTSKKA